MIVSRERNEQVFYALYMTFYVLRTEHVTAKIIYKNPNTRISFNKILVKDVAF
jgi:hypothetical protein